MGRSVRSAWRGFGTVRRSCIGREQQGGGAAELVRLGGIIAAEERR